jgi:DNA-directed RNA polymerase subunit E'/Rpb7
MCFNSIYINNIELQPNELLHVHPDQINEKITDKLKTKIESKCNKHGLVLPGSLQIINRTIGFSPNEQFNGFFVYKVKYQVRICNPANGTVLPAKIINKNKLGVLTHIITDFENESKHFKKYPLNALLPRQIHNDVPEEVFEEMKIGDIIYVEIVGKKFDIPDKTISFIVKLSNEEKYGTQ